MSRWKNKTRPGPEPEIFLRALEEACAKLSIEVRYKDFSGDEIRPASGRCRVRGRNFILVDGALSPAGRLRALAVSMKGLDLEGVFLPPAARLLVESP